MAYEKKTNNPKLGRPKKKIDKDQFKKLCSIQCTLAEIASFFDCSEDTIENWCKSTFDERFSDCFKRFSAAGKISLRRIQFQMAEHNCTMALWLGKQYLGQRETVEQSVQATSTVELIAKQIMGENE